MFGISDEVWEKYSRKEKIYVFCQKTHLLGAAQFFNRKVLGNTPVQPEPDPVQAVKPVSKPEPKPAPKPAPKPVSPEMQWERIAEKFEKAKDQFRCDIPSDKRKIVFSGHVLEFDKGVCSFLNRMNKELDNTEILLLSHATKQQFSKSNSLINVKYFSLPFTFGLNRYEPGVNVEVPEEFQEIVNEKEYLKLNEERIRLRHKDMGEGYPMAMTYFLYNYYCEFLDYFKPENVILWCEFYCGHNILKDICEERGINVIYMEFGSFPGTMALELNGEMGESDVAVKWEEFKELPVTEEDLMNAGEILEYLKDSKLNRRTQQKTDALERFSKKYKPRRPVIVMFGQNDYESGIKPYTERSEKYHSPIFRSSDEAALYVEKLARKNNWNYIYKPHQMMVRVGECLESSFSKNTLWVGDSDINELIDIADVAVTIVSQCGYVSLIRDTATVMLGNTQLKGKGCAYEPASIDEVESVIKEAVKKGYTQQQKEAFRKHAAQMFKYYLFDDGLPKDYVIGQDSDAIRDYLDKIAVSGAEKNDYPERKALFFCTNECEIQSAINLRISLNHNTSADLLILNRGKFNEMELPDLIRQYCEWDNIFFTADINDEFEAKLTQTSYTDLFVAGYKRNHLILFRGCRAGYPEISVHLYDGGDPEFYLKNITKDAAAKNIVGSFFHFVKDIYMYDRDFLVYKNKINIKIFDIPDSDMMFIRKWMGTGRKNIYAESYLMDRGCISNESELLEKTGGPKRTAVVPACAKSKAVFEMDGYSICDKETGSETKNIYSPVFNGVYFYLSREFDYKFTDLSRLLFTSYYVINSNTYKIFLEICAGKAKERNRYFQPVNTEEFQYLVEHF